MKRGSDDRPDWKRVEQVLDRLLDEHPDAEASGLAVDRRRLDELCDGDDALRQEVEAVLAEVGPREDLFGRGLADSLSDLLSELDDIDEVGDGPPAATIAEGDDARIAGRTLDRYRLLEVLGRGGMGVVYLAERADAQFEKRVALKVIPRGLESAEKERRFLVERQILARLEHENIARLLDGGVTEEGYPYLAMELVEGLAIDLYCERHRLDRRARLELFLEVCAAVQYAHENLVLHRDLKPANILVSAEGRVKLLDFGVGKILDDPDPAEGTRVQPMTPRYASPEQRENRPVSTATDVYSLGLVLRQLLTGAKPAEPEPDSAPRLPGDLRVILDKALRESPERRFRSVGEMAADLRRFLGGHPIESRPATVRYRFGKFVARHRLGTLSALVVVVLLATAVLAIAWQGRLARQERDRARLEARKARTVADLMAGLFSSTDPNSPSAGQLSAQELLGQGEARIREELTDDPEILRELLTVIGSAHVGLGDNERGSALLEEAVALHRSRRPFDALAFADTLRQLAIVEYDSGELDRARAHLEEALELLGQGEALESAQAAATLRDLGRVETIANRHERAVRHFREALRLLESQAAAVDVALLKTDLALQFRRTGRLEEALDLEREAIATFVAERGPDHPMVADTRNNLGLTLFGMGEYAEAEQLFRDVVASGERTYGPDHPTLANGLSNLGKVLMDQGRFAEAAAPIRRAAEIREAASAPDNYSRIAVEMNLAALELALGEVGEAIEIYRSGLERFERLTGQESAPSVRVRGLLGVALHRAGQTAEAERLLRRAHAAQDPEVAAVSRAELLVGLGAVLADGGEGAEAEPLLRQAIALMVEALPANHWKTAEARVELAGALLRLASAGTSQQDEAKALLASTAVLDLEQPGFGWLRSRLEAFEALATP